MTLWLMFALMTAAAIFAVLWPLSRRVAESGGSELEVYRDQLEEIAHDRAAGLIGESEAEAAKVEVSRRLIAAADAAEFNHAAPVGSPLWRRRAAAIAAIGLAVRAITCRSQWSAADSETSQMGLVDSYARTFLLVLLSLLGLLALGVMYGNVLGSVNASQ